MAMQFYYISNDKPWDRKRRGPMPFRHFEILDGITEFDSTCVQEFITFSGSQSLQTANGILKIIKPQDEWKQIK